MKARSLVAGVVAALAVVLGLVISGPAYAHDVVVSSDPVDGSEVDALPAVITITFDGPPQGPTAKVGVLVGDAPPVTMEGAVQGNALLIDTAAPELADRVADPAGPWVVSYQIVSSDGDPVTGSVSFTVKAAPSASPTASPGVVSGEPSSPDQLPSETAPPSDSGQVPDESSEVADGSGTGWWVYVVIGVAAIGAAAAIARILTRRPPTE